MSSIDQTYMTGTPSASGGQGALLSSETRQNTTPAGRPPGNEGGGASPVDRVAPVDRGAATAPGPRATAPDERGGESSRGAPAAGIDRGALSEAVEEMRERLEPGKRALNFSINDELGDVVVKVVDTTTDQVIREIPPEAIMEMRERLRELNETGAEGGFPPGSLLSDLT
jgi:uncharacterized FlaG/YvyC family protein